MIDKEIITLIEENSNLKVNRDLSDLITYGFNKVFLIQDSTSKYILRISSSNKPVVITEEDYLFELDLLQYLKDNNFPIVCPIKWKNNSFLLTKTIENELFYYCLFNFADGKSLETLNAHEYFIYGKFVAELHKQMGLFKSEYKRFTWDLEKILDVPVKQFKKMLFGSLPDEYSELLLLKEWLKDKLSYFSDLVPFGLVHGDVQNFNVHFLDDSTFTMFDFDFMGYNYLAFDIACMIGTENAVFIFNTDNKVRNTLSLAQKEFIKGYQTIRKLTKDEIRILPLLEMERIIMLFGSWAGIIDFHGNMMMEDQPLTEKEFFTQRIKEIFPHLQELKSKWIKNDFFYYNEILNL